MLRAGRRCAAVAGCKTPRLDPPHSPSGRGITVTHPVPMCLASVVKQPRKSRESIPYPSPKQARCVRIRDEVDPIRRLPHRTGTESFMTAVEQQGIAWERDWDAAIHRARQERRLLLIDVEKEH